MFDVLKTLSGLVKTKRQAVRTKVKAVPAVRSQEKPVKTAPVPSPVSLPVVPVINRKEIEAAQAELRLAQSQAKEIILEAKDEAMRLHREAEGELRRRSESIDRHEGSLDERDKRLVKLEEDIRAKLSDIEKIKQDAFAKLEKAAHLTRDEAHTQLLEDVKAKSREDVAREIRDAVARAHEEAETKAREILVDAMRHGATDYVAEYTVSVVKIADDDVKGRIIGKEGRNIRAFETATGVDVDLDEEGIIRLSCFDPVRREVARVSLERLMRDGRVQPGRIEEIVAQVRKEIERIMFDEGQKLCHAVGVYNLPAPIVALLGRFKYRTSYGQNMIAHTLEETQIGIALAHEVGSDANIVRLGCLLHDIGKVVPDGEGSHVELGVTVLKKYGLPPKVIDCVAQHHEDTPFTSLESMLVYIADAISGSRPGARHEDVEGYIKRLKDLEEIAKSKNGVRESFAFSAGRELRVMVDPGSVDDAQATIMASEIKDEIQAKLTFPGQIKVTVVRELRATEIAK
ncbi:MAG: ribonuclease Y [Patescibacteria group bacterium]